MSNAEHAFENALSAIKKGIDYETWAKTEPNLIMMCATASEIWDMALYCYLNFEEKK